MSDRERLIDLMIEAKRTEPETGSFTDYLADYLLEHGVIVPCRIQGYEYYVCIETGEVFLSQKEAGQSKGIAHQHICDCCKGKKPNLRRLSLEIHHP